jgi:hypothetical protein
LLNDVAQVAGLFPGDRIITINNRTIHKHSRGSILKLIAAAGSNVDIGVVYDPMRLDELNTARASKGKALSLQSRRLFKMAQYACTSFCPQCRLTSSIDNLYLLRQQPSGCITAITARS